MAVAIAVLEGQSDFFVLWFVYWCSLMLEEENTDAGGNASAALIKQMQKAADYHRALQENLKQREGEGELDLLDAKKSVDPLTQMGSQMSSYSTVFVG